jgi:hypothetical protein
MQRAGDQTLVFCLMNDLGGVSFVQIPQEKVPQIDPQLLGGMEDRGRSHLQVFRGGSIFRAWLLRKGLDQFSGILKPSRLLCVLACHRVT